MCVVLVCPKEVRPDFDTLAACEQANPHGGGIAWRDGKHVVWRKSDDVREIHRLAGIAKGEIVIHFRIASVGAVCAELRHPFPVDYRASLKARGKAKAVLFQNGTWPGWRKSLEFAESEGHRIPPGPMSDARAAAWLCSIFGHKFLEKCEPSRWVYFSHQETALFGQWHQRHGISFSNLYWESRRVEPLRAPQNASNGQPKPTGHKTKLEAELELWDISGQESYWDIINRNCRKR
jgi:hypothetical protein